MCTQVSVFVTPLQRNFNSIPSIPSGVTNCKNETVIPVSGVLSCDHRAQSIRAKMVWETWILPYTDGANTISLPFLYDISPVVSDTLMV